MSKIDKRIVEMAFENKGFEKGIKESSQSLKDFEKALGETSKSGSSFGALGDIAESIGGKFSAFGAIAVGALMRIGSRAVDTGLQLAKSLSLDQVTAGFQEYELKIGSIRTMLAGGRDKNGLPVTLKMVNDQLEALNKYSDQTIYSFSDMTRNIGKFTNAGVDLETAVQAIKGISNAAALSGSNAEEASRAMYNFSQALSAGYVKLIDWKSIENANMATVDFKTELIKTAAELGTVKENADGTYKVLTDGGWNLPLSPTKNFNDSLQKQWMTSEVLTQTLTKYTDTTTELGKKATEAATKVRTFTQLMDTTKEAIGSGWAMTSENIFGDYEEATNFWSAISQKIGDVIQKSSDARNRTLKMWKILGGRQAVIDGLDSIINLIFASVTKLKEAFYEIFPKTTAADLARLSFAFRDFFKNLESKPEILDGIASGFKTFFTFISLAWKTISSVLKGLIDGFKEMFKIFNLGSGSKFANFGKSIVSFFENLNDSTKKANTFTKISKSITDAIINFSNKIKEAYNIIKDSKFAEILLSIFKGIKDIFSEIDFKNIGDSISNFFEKIKGFFKHKWEIEGLDKAGEKIKNFFGSIKKAPGIPKEATAISEFFGKIKDFVKEKWETEGLTGIINIIKSILSGGLIVGLTKFIKSITGFSDSIGGVGEGITGILDGFKGVLKGYQDQLNSKKLLVIATAIGILVAALTVITLLDQEKLTSGIAVITTLFIELSAGLVALNAMGNGNKAAKQMLALSGSILILALALNMLRGLDPNAIYALSIILGELVIANIILSKMPDGNKGTVGLMGMAAAIDLITLAVVILGKMNVNKLKQGIAAVGVLMVEMLAFSVIMGNYGGNSGSLLVAGIAMGIISVALLQLVGVVAILAQFDIKKLVTGLIGLSGIMLIMAVGMNAIGNPRVLLGAAAMLIIAAAVTLFVPAIAALGSLPIKTIGVGLLAIAGVFAVLGIAGLVLAPVLPVIMGLSISLALLGGAMFAAGAGMILFGTGLGLVSAAGAGAIAVLVFAIKEIVSLIPFILTKVGEGLVALIQAIGKAAPELMTAIGDIITALLDLIVEKIPEIVETILTLVGTLLEILVEKVPEFVDAGMKIILGFLEGISNNIGQIIETIFQMVINILNAIAEKLPDLIKAGADVIIAFMDGIAEQVPNVVDAGFNMIIDLINGLADSIETNTPLILEAAGNLATAFLDGLKDYFKVEEGESLAGNIILGLINGIIGGIQDVVNAAIELGKGVIAAVKGAFEEKSPSKVMEEIGKFADLGLANGIKKYSNKVLESSEKLGDESINSFRSAMNKISDVISSDINSNPVITPVLNLNNIKAGTSSLNGLLSTSKSYSLAIDKIKQDAMSIETNQNGSTNLDSNGQIIKNEFNLNGLTIRSEADIDTLVDKLYRKQEEMMRSRGLRPSYTY